MLVQTKVKEEEKRGGGEHDDYRGFESFILLQKHDEASPSKVGRVHLLSVQALMMTLNDCYVCELIVFYDYNV